MTKDIPTEIDRTFSELIRIISSFDQEQINTVPFEGSWSAGQLARHLIKSGSGFAKIMKGPVKENERKPDEKVENIRKDFLDFSTKMTSPEFVAPKKINYNKEDLLNSLGNINEEIKQSARTLDLTKTCTAFELPGFGAFTRLEAIYFVIFHTQRHIHQLKNIHKKVTGKKIQLKEVRNV